MENEAQIVKSVLDRTLHLSVTQIAWAYYPRSKLKNFDRTLSDASEIEEFYPKYIKQGPTQPRLLVDELTVTVAVYMTDFYHIVKQAAMD
ncbi:hypothetical protein DL765_000627 [Monosporascus sp. GIB2]|nr:hypothetical protein DL765_000627 [Monosporascus sp. GIB2]